MSRHKGRYDRGAIGLPCGSPQRLRSGALRSVPELTAAISEYIAMHNQNPKPFVWTAKAHDILAKVIRANRN